jgi:predicted secreted hydrolase
MPPKSNRKREREYGETLSPPDSPARKEDTSQWPAYFPAPRGPIDVAKYDLPQGQAPLEWWYYNCHVTTKKDPNRRYSLFSSFFRQADLSTLDDEARKDPTKRYDFYDACTWALVDVEKNVYYADSLLDHRAPSRIEAALDPAVTGKPVSHIEGPLLDLVKRGRVPLPDRLMRGPAKVSTEELSLNLGNDCILTSRPYNAATDGPQVPGALGVVYQIKLYNPNRAIRADLTFVPQRGAIRHGDNGVVNHMFYYYVPRCTVRGTIVLNGERLEVEGSGWYDREFGGTRDETGRDATDAWSWFSCPLDDGTEFSLFHIVDRLSQHEKAMVGVLTDASGNRIAVHDVQLSYSDMWTSMTTYMEYPQSWKIVVPSLQLELFIGMPFPHQEFVTVIVNGGGFFEGRTQISGTRAGHAVTGTGFLERKNHVNYKDTDGLMRNVGRFVKKTLTQMYPLEATQEWVNRYVLGRHCTGSANSQQVCESLFKPVRTLIDRGGKSWRSLILVSAVNALSREPYFDCSKYIAIAELLHSGR